MNEDLDLLVLQWISIVKTQDDTLIEKCLKMAKLLEYPNLDVQTYVEKVNEIGQVIKNVIPKSDNPKYLLSLLNEEFFKNYKFKGNKEDYYNPKNNL